jgi:hypothetical protein
MTVQTPSIAQYAFERSYPTRDTVRNVFAEQDLQRAIEAYRFFYPTVSAEALFVGGIEAGIEPGKKMMMLAAGPQHLIFTANSDTPYASGGLDLQTTGPVVIDVPAGPYIALVNDHHQRWVVDMGIPGPDAGEGGKYLVLPPGFRGNVPAGFHVDRALTNKILVAVRALPIGGDQAGALKAIERVKVHPLAKPDQPLVYVDVTNRAIDSTPLRWEDNIGYWETLHAVIDGEPVLEEFRPMYGMLATLGIAKGKPFAPNARTRRILETAAKIALDQMRVEAFANGRPDCIVWKDRKWEWVGLIPDDGDFETKEFLDLQARDRWFVQAVVASPAMFRRKVGSGSVYFLAARDRDGAYLDGARAYKINVPRPVPAKLFWSVTAYDARTRSQVQAPQNKAVLGSLRDKFEPNADASVDLFLGPSTPSGKEKQWIQTAPGTGVFLYFRIYGPEAPSLDGSWKVGDVTPL